MTQLADRISDLLEPAVSALGFELVGVEYVPQGQHSLLRVYIDADDGITVDDCATVSHQVAEFSTSRNRYAASTALRCRRRVWTGRCLNRRIFTPRWATGCGFGCANRLQVGASWLVCWNGVTSRPVRCVMTKDKCTNWIF